MSSRPVPLARASSLLEALGDLSDDEEVPREWADLNAAVEALGAQAPPEEEAEEEEEASAEAVLHALSLFSRLERQPREPQAPVPLKQPPRDVSADEGAEGEAFQRTLSLFSRRAQRSRESRKPAEEEPRPVPLARASSLLEALGDFSEDEEEEEEEEEMPRERRSLQAAVEALWAQAPPEEEAEEEEEASEEAVLHALSLFSRLERQPQPQPPPPPEPGLGRAILRRALSGRSDCPYISPRSAAQPGLLDLSAFERGEEEEGEEEQEGEIAVRVGAHTVRLAPGLVRGYLRALLEFTRASGMPLEDGVDAVVDLGEPQTVLDVLTALAQPSALLAALDRDPEGCVQCVVDLELGEVVETALDSPEAALLLLRAAMMADHSQLKHEAVQAVMRHGADALQGTRAWALASPQLREVAQLRTPVVPGAVPN